ncbi:MAG: hypothetical protein ACOVNY_06070 [Chitinophagaceae bacterium]
MKTSFVSCIALFVFLFTSCSSVYKTGQTPDDVYYSPVREGAVVEKEERNISRDPEDRYLRMKVANRNRWGVIDDFNYWNDSRFDYCNRFNNWAYTSPWNNYLGFYNYHPSRYGWGGWYNPVYTIIGYKSPVNASGYSAKSNLSAYQNGNYSNNNTYVTDPKTGVKTPVNNNNGLGNLIRRIIIPASSNGNGSSNTSTTVDKPVRTFEPNTSTQSSAGGSSGGVNSKGSSSSSSRKPRG